MTSSDAKKKSCQLCKLRKVRCDKQEPSCKRCLRSNQACTYAKKKQGISFRHSRLSALVAESEIEAEAESTSFVGNNHSASSWEHAQDSENSILNSSSSISRRSIQGRRVPINAHITSYSPSSQTQDPISPTSYISPGPPSVYPLPSHTPENVSHGSPETTRTAPFESPCASGLSLSPTNTNATSSSGRHGTIACTPIEGELLHFYIENIGPWLDVTSPERHYTYTVPRLAKLYRVLHSAIMACSAHILRLLHKDQTDLANTEEEYQSESVRLLIPVLNDLESAVQNEAILATIAILRMSEQYDEYHVDRQCHLVPGAFVHLGPSIPSSTSMGGLLQATFYSYVRADLRMAILGQCGTKLSVETWPYDESSPSTDADWANRMTWLLVHVINLCYGRNVHGVMPYMQLKTLIEEWKVNVPSSFDPYFYKEEPRDAFPMVRLVCPWHVVGLQFYHASVILLATHYPPRDIFNNAFQFHKYLEANIIFHVRMLCAISFSNEHFGCRINASHLLAMGSCFLTGRQEQWCVRDYFKMLQNERAWPSRACMEMLDTAWAA